MSSSTHKAAATGVAGTSIATLIYALVTGDYQTALAVGVSLGPAIVLVVGKSLARAWVFLADNGGIRGVVASVWQGRTRAARGRAARDEIAAATVS